MKKYVIYTAIIGSYDSIQQPLEVDDEFEYIIFSDCITEKRVGVWEIKRIEYTNPVQTKIARYIKTHPHILLKDYTCTLWVDATVVIKSKYIYKRIKELYEKGNVISALTHPERGCVYEEASAVLLNGFEKEDVVLNWVTHLRKELYPWGNGLCETRLLYRRQTEGVAQMNEEWWKCIDKYSRRDQLSFNYVLWKHNIQYTEFFPENVSVRDSEHMQVASHTFTPNKNVYINSARPMLLQVLNFYPEYEHKLRDAYLRIFESRNPSAMLTIYNVWYRGVFKLKLTKDWFYRKVKKFTSK